MYFGSILSSCGTHITIVEYLPRVGPHEDADVSKELARNFPKRGIDTHTGAKVDKVDLVAKVTAKANSIHLG